VQSLQTKITSKRERINELHQSNSLICEENALTGTNNIHKKYLLKNLSESRLHAYWNAVSRKRSQLQTLQIEQTNKLALRCDTHGSRWCNALSEHTQLHAGARRVICLHVHRAAALAEIHVD